MRTLLCTALLRAPCACAAAVRRSTAMVTTAAYLNAVVCFLQKEINTAFVFFAQIITLNDMVRRFSKSGDFSIFSCFLLSRMSVKALP